MATCITQLCHSESVEASVKEAKPRMAYGKIARRRWFGRLRATTVPFISGQSCGLLGANLHEMFELTYIHVRPSIVQLEIGRPSYQQGQLTADWLLDCHTEETCSLNPSPTGTAIRNLHYTDLTFSATQLANPSPKARGCTGLGTKGMACIGYAPLPVDLLSKLGNVITQAATKFC